MAQSKCSIFQKSEDFGVLDVSIQETKETKEFTDPNGNVVTTVTTESLISIRKEERKPKESTGIKAKSILVSGVAFSGALIGVLSNLPGAIGFVEKTLHLI